MTRAGYIFREHFMLGWDPSFGNIQNINKILLLLHFIAAPPVNIYGFHFHYELLLPLQARSEPFTSCSIILNESTSYRHRKATRPAGFGTTSKQRRLNVGPVKTPIAKAFLSFNIKHKMLSRHFQHGSCRQTLTRRTRLTMPILTIQLP